MKRLLFILLFILSITSPALGVSYPEGTIDNTGVVHGAGYIGKQIATPTAPSAGHDYLYPKSDNKWYTQSPAGVEVLVGPPSGTGITSLNTLTGDTQTFANDTNVTMTSKGTTHTLGFTGTLAAGRLNSNVVQALVDDTNIAGTITSQTLTLGWTGILSEARGGSGLSSLPYRDVRSYASLNAAVAAIGATQSVLVVSNAQTLTASLTIPSTLSLRIDKGGSIAKASTYTLTINGPFEAGLYQVFSGFAAGDVTFANGFVKDFYSEWWGAVADGTTQSSTAINCALTAGPTQLSIGTYLINATVKIPIYSSLKGRGKLKTTIHSDSAIDMVESVTVDTAGSTVYIEIGDLTVQGTAGTTTGGIEIGTASVSYLSSEIYIHNIRVINTIRGLIVNSSVYSSYRDILICNSDTNGTYGLAFNSQTQEALCENVIVRGFQYNWYITGTGVKTINCVSYTEATDTHTVNLLKVEDASKNIFTKMIFEHLASTTINEVLLVSNTSSSKYTDDNIFENCYWAGTGANGTRLVLGVVGASYYPIYRTVIKNSVFVDNSVYDINYANASGTHVENCVNHVGYTSSTWNNPVTTGTDAALVFISYNGSITGSTALTFTAGGTNQNLTLSPSGTGMTIITIPIEATGTAREVLRVSQPTPVTGSGGSAFISILGAGGGVAKIEQVGAGGSGLFGTYSDTNFINNYTAAAGPYGNINFVTNNSIQAKLTGGNAAGKFGVGFTTWNGVPTRRLESLDASNPQLRLTQADGTKYVDFQVDGSSNLTLTNLGRVSLNSFANLAQTYTTTKDGTANANDGWYAWHEGSGDYGQFTPQHLAIIHGANGSHTGAANAAALTDSTKAWVTSQWVGYTISNNTDSSSCVITANTATTVTCTLAGGSDNDWDVGDLYFIPITNEHSTVSIMRYDNQSTARETAAYFFGLKGTGTIKGVRDGLVSYTESDASYGSYAATRGMNSLVGVTRIIHPSDALGVAIYADAGLGSNHGAVQAFEVIVRNNTGATAPASFDVGGTEAIKIVGAGGSPALYNSVGIDFAASSKYGFRTGIYFGTETLIDYGIDFSKTHTDYVEGTDGKTYKCILTHVSAADTRPTTGASWATYWVEVTTIAGDAGWVTATSYYMNQNEVNILLANNATIEGRSFLDNANLQLLKTEVDNSLSIGSADVSYIGFSNSAGTTMFLAANGLSINSASGVGGLNVLDHGVHIGGTTDPGDNNLLVDGIATIVGAFGTNGKAAQTSYSVAAWDEPGAGAFGVDSAAHMAALVQLVQDIQAALIANGILSTP